MYWSTSTSAFRSTRAASRPVGSHWSAKGCRLPAEPAATVAAPAASTTTGPSQARHAAAPATATTTPRTTAVIGSTWMPVVNGSPQPLTTMSKVVSVGVVNLCTLPVSRESCRDTESAAPHTANRPALVRSQDLTGASRAAIAPAPTMTRTGAVAAR